MVAFPGTPAPQPSSDETPDVVEIGLLLPASRVHALIELSRKKEQSVGQILRDLIERALLDGEIAPAADQRFDGFSPGSPGTFV
jgi:hypothetical protein